MKFHIYSAVQIKILHVLLTIYMLILVYQRALALNYEHIYNYD